MSDLFFLLIVGGAFLILFMGIRSAQDDQEDKLDRRAYFNERFRADRIIMESRMSLHRIYYQQAIEDGDALMAAWQLHQMHTPIPADDPDRQRNKKMCDEIFYPDGGAPA